MKKSNTDVGDDVEKIELSHSAGGNAVSTVDRCCQHLLKLKNVHILRPSNSAFTLTRKNSHMCVLRDRHSDNYYLY